MRVLLFLGLLTSTCLCNAQSTEQSKWSWGLQLGLNKSGISEQGGDANGIVVFNDLGWEVGGVLQARLSDHWRFSQLAGLTFNNGRLQYSAGDNQVSYKVLPKSIDVA